MSEEDKIIDGRDGWATYELEAQRSVEGSSGEEKGKRCKRGWRKDSTENIEGVENGEY